MSNICHRQLFFFHCRKFMPKMTTVIKSQIPILNWRQFLKILDLNTPPVGTEADQQNITTKILSSLTCYHKPDRRWQRDGFRRLDTRYPHSALNIKFFSGPEAAQWGTSCWLEHADNGQWPGALRERDDRGAHADRPKDREGVLHFQEKEGAILQFSS